MGLYNSQGSFGGLIHHGAYMLWCLYMMVKNSAVNQIECSYFSTRQNLESSKMECGAWKSLHMKLNRQTGVFDYGIHSFYKTDMSQVVDVDRLRRTPYTREFKLNSS